LKGEDATGEIWFQKYKILGLLGRGATASVYLAEHVKLNSYRAIKFISKRNPLYELHRKEAYILKSLKHACIPIIYDIEEDEEGSYIVEEYIKGVSLREFVSKNGALREDIAIDFAMQICDLLICLNSEGSIIYPDLKPENILVSDMKIKLIDFGSAIFLDEETGNQKYTGTRGYAAPELYRQGRIDERCEVYGIGMLLYYMVTGIVIKGDMDYTANIDHAGACSKRTKYIINKCLKYNPSQRYSSVKLLYRHLSALRKNQFQIFPAKPITIAVAGAQPRIGVTHFSFRLCKFYKSLNYSCLYVESNDSGCVQAIKSRYYGIAGDNGRYRLMGIDMLAGAAREQELPEGYQVIVMDFGSLTEDKLDPFLKADLRLLLLGAKDWELDLSERVLELTAGYTKHKEIVYLFNFMNGRQFYSALKSMGSSICYRIPYEPDPFAAPSRKNGRELFAEIASMSCKGAPSPSGKGVAVQSANEAAVKSGLGAAGKSGKRRIGRGRLFNGGKLYET